MDTRQKIYLRTLLMIGAVYLIFSIWFFFWKPANKDFIFLFLPSAIILIVISSIFLFNDKPKRWFLQKPVRFYWVGIGIAFLILIPLGYLYGGKEYKGNVLVEAHGLLFDLLVFGILWSLYDTMKKQDENDKKEENERRLRIERHQEQIDYLRHWKSDEAKFIIRGHIQSLNKEKITKIDMSHIDISGLENKGSQKLRIENLKLDGSTLHHSNLSHLNLLKPSFNNMKYCSYSQFVGIITMKAEFKNSHLQEVDFSCAILNGADFTGSTIVDVSFKRANLKGVVFKNLTISIATFNDDINIDHSFEDAWVNPNFFEQIKEWNVEGANIFQDYKIVDHNNGKYFLSTNPNYIAYATYSDDLRYGSLTKHYTEVALWFFTSFFEKDNNKDIS